jgi:hypothetical protein
MALESKDNNLAMEDVFAAADNQIKKIAVRTIIVIAIVLGALYLDRPIYSGSIKGHIVSTAISQDAYKSVTATTKANIELENGATIYKDIRGAKTGDSVNVSVYKRRVTGVVSYQ